MTTTKTPLESIGVRMFDPNETMKVLTHNLNIFWSWGVGKLIVVGLDPHDSWVNGLMLKVNGRKWKHFVLITLNGLDYYEVRLVNKDHEVVEVKDHDIMFTELVEVIDNLIES